MSAKCAQQSLISTKFDFNIPDLCPKPLIITGGT